MTDLGQVLAAIRFADSAFPSGGFAFSSGLEGSHRDGFVRTEADVEDFTAEQIERRWNHCDRVLLRGAWVAAEPFEADALAEAVATMSVLREASRRAGAALLGTFAAVLQSGVAEYRSAVLTGATPGHLPVAQAVCLRAAGLTLEHAEIVAAWHALSGIIGAAVRLGIIGHLGAQRVTTSLMPVLLELFEREIRSTPASFTAYADIAAQRRGDGTRLFAS